MAKYLFPAIFDAGENGSDGYTITFPDLPGCISEGENVDDAMIMAKDALEGFLYGMEEDGEDIPSPLRSKIYQSAGNRFCCYGKRLDRYCP